MLARMRNGALLVARTTRSGHAAASSATSGAAPISCSRLSRTTRIRRPVRYGASAVTERSVRFSGTPRAEATRGRTIAGSRTAASSTQTMPPGNAAAVCPSREATSRASRVLPTPPGPVTVTTRCSGASTRSVSAATSWSRPMVAVPGAIGDDAMGWLDVGAVSPAAPGVCVRAARLGTAPTSSARSPSSSWSASASDRTVCG